MRKNKKIDIDEFMEVIAQEIFRQEYEKCAALFEQDEQFQQNKHLVENFRYEKKAKKKFPRGMGRFLAAAAVVCIVFTIVMPISEANAWRIWDLDFWFGEHADHTEIKPNTENAFPQYYLSTVPEGFQIIFEDTTATSIIIHYQNQQDQFILYTQVNREEFLSQLDNEHHELKEETIGDFEVLISENEQDLIFEAVTDRVAITVQTDAGYEVGKNFIASLKEI